MAVSNTQLQAHKLMQEFAFSRPGLLPGVLAPPGGALLPLAAHAGPGPNEQLALVPVMIQNPDGSFTGAYQVQPYPSGFSTDGVLPELPGALPPMLAGIYPLVFTWVPLVAHLLRVMPFVGHLTAGRRSIVSVKGLQSSKSLSLAGQALWESHVAS